MSVLITLWQSDCWCESSAFLVLFGREHLAVTFITNEVWATDSRLYLQGYVITQLTIYCVWFEIQLIQIFACKNDLSSWKVKEHCSSDTLIRGITHSFGSHWLQWDIISDLWYPIPHFWTLSHSFLPVLILYIFFLKTFNKGLAICVVLQHSFCDIVLLKRHFTCRCTGTGNRGITEISCVLRHQFLPLQDFYTFS